MPWRPRRAASLWWCADGVTGKLPEWQGVRARLVHPLHHPGRGDLARGQVRPLIHAISDQENEFGDDATVMSLEWRASRFRALSSRAIA
jgi:hypothetical protein